MNAARNAENALDVTLGHQVPRRHICAEAQGPRREEQILHARVYGSSFGTRRERALISEGRPGPPRSKLGERAWPAQHSAADLVGVRAEVVAGHDKRRRFGEVLSLVTDRCQRSCVLILAGTSRFLGKCVEVELDD